MSEPFPEAFIRSLPKAELHVHLEGSVGAERIQHGIAAMGARRAGRKLDPRELRPRGCQGALAGRFLVTLDPRNDRAAASDSALPSGSSSVTMPIDQQSVREANHRIHPQASSQSARKEESPCQKKSFSTPSPPCS